MFKKIRWPPWGQLRAAIAGDTRMRSDSARLIRIKRVLNRVAVASGTSGMRFCDDGICSKTGLDGRFFGHKMCRIFRNIRSFKLVVLDVGEIR